MTPRKPYKARKAKSTPTLVKQPKDPLILYLDIVEEATREAKKLGYALTTHGSFERDLDIVAIAWTQNASDPREVAEAIRKAAAKVSPSKAAFIAPHEDDSFHRNGQPGTKPHGRLGWSFHLGGGPYVDLSVIPPSWYKPLNPNGTMKCTCGDDTPNTNTPNNFPCPAHGPNGTVGA